MMEKYIYQKKMPPLPQNITELLETFSEISDIKEKFEFLIELAEDLENFPESQKIPENKIIGCASDAWIRITKDKNTDPSTGSVSDIIKISGTGDAVISKGILAFFIQCFKGLSASEILEMKPEFSDALLQSKIISSLSPSRANGANAMLEKIYAKCKQI